MKFLPLFFSLLIPASAIETITFDNNPLGTAEKPLLLRTYIPDIGMEEAVFSQHGKGGPVSKYHPGLGQDVKGDVQPFPGIPAAIAVNFGPSLSFAFDTTECRVLYAWQGGFLDMTPYWGSSEKGNRLSFDYVPRLVGTVFHQASGDHPVQLSGKSLTTQGPRVFEGYQLKNGIPTFTYKVNKNTFTLTLTPSDKPLSLKATLTSTSEAPLSYRGIDHPAAKTALKFELTGTKLKSFQGYQRDIKLDKASLAAGEKLFGNYGCATCHSTDGSKSHGPSLKDVAGHKVEIEGSTEPVLADKAYLLESIKSPNAKLVKGYPPNYMPPYGLPDVEYDSLILYIESLATHD